MRLSGPHDAQVSDLRPESCGASTSTMLPYGDRTKMLPYSDTPQAEVEVICRDDLPLTPDWVPESRCSDGCPESAVPHGLRLRVVTHISEALALWDRDWATWAGDQA